MALAALPTELLDALAAYLPAPRDLTALARTSQALNSPAERALYRALWLSSAAHNLPCLRTLARRPHIARYVRNLTVALDPSQPTLQPLYRLLARALANTTELLSLSLALDSRASFVLRQSIAGASGPRYPRLQTFSCNLSLDPAVAAFLSHTPAVTQLQLDASSSFGPRIPRVDLPLSSLPLLTSFSGTPTAALALAPGRPLSSVYLGAGELSDDGICALALSSTPILMLSVYTDAPALPLLESLASKLPSLVYLRLEATSPLATQPDLAFYEHVGKILTALPDLSGFELSGVHFRPELKPSPLSSSAPSPASTSSPLADSPRSTSCLGVGTKIWQSSRPSSPIPAYQDLDDEEGMYDFA